MARIVKPLTETQIKNAKPKSKDYKLFDGRGLFILITKKGYKWWRMKYKLNGKEQLISIGIYPTVTLARARQEREKIKQKLLDNINPQKKEVKNFGDITKEWFEFKSDSKNKRTYTKNYILPAFGHMDISTIEESHIVDLGQKIDSSGKIETRRRVIQALEQIFKYAIAKGYTKTNIIANIDKRSIFKPKSQKHYPTITDEKKLGELLRAIDNYHGSIITKCALQLAPHIFLRPYNIRFLEWSEIQGDFIRIPAEKMKMKTPHIIPLTKQVKDIICNIKNLTGDGKYLFPSPTTMLKPISESTLVHALRRLDYSKDEIVAHSFRGIASTILHENISSHNIHSDAIERQLAHSERNSVKAAYNHAEYLPERIKLMQWWSDYLEKIKTL